MYLNKRNRKIVEQILNKSLSNFPNIFANGSISGMIKLYGWERGGTVQNGGYIYHIGADNVNKIKQSLT